MEETLIRSRDRVKKYGEVFTPIPLVLEMLSMLPSDAWTLSATFLDNSCGNGNFLVEILKHKLSLGHDPLIALSTIYGVELLSDNAFECKQRLRDIMLLHVSDLDAINRILDTNIVCADALKYDYSFGEKE